MRRADYRFRNVPPVIALLNPQTIGTRGSVIGSQQTVKAFSIGCAIENQSLSFFPKDSFRGFVLQVEMTERLPTWTCRVDVIDAGPVAIPSNGQVGTDVANVIAVGREQLGRVVVLAAGISKKPTSISKGTLGVTSAPSAGVGVVELPGLPSLGWAVQKMSL